MARKNQLVGFNTFVAGLLTEASPLTFPDNASIDEANFELRKDGSRRRRLGMNMESEYSVVNAATSIPSSNELAVSAYRWKNAGGNIDTELLVVQLGSVIKIFDLGVTPISSSVLYTINIGSETQIASYTTVDGLLIIASNNYELTLVDCNSFGDLSSDTFTLKIRDLFGVEDTYLSEDLTQGSGLSLRPPTLSHQHLYNLRNQSWAMARLDVDFATKIDPINKFYLTNLYSKFPSNADSAVYAMYADAQRLADPISERFQPLTAQALPSTNSPAPKGYFIIDALRRGSSRVAEYAKLVSKFPELVYTDISDLNSEIDTTPGGASCVTTYSGRVFYAGFSGEVQLGYDSSPKMSSYVLYSKLVRNKTDLGLCYQEGDPTDSESPELLDTDGGYIVIKEMYGVKKMVNVGNALIIVAENGVWSIKGGSGYGFTSTNYLVDKISTHGCVSPNSVVQIDSEVMYWGDDGIYHIKRNQFGDLIVENITSKTIQTLYDDISYTDKSYAAGIYDSYANKISWLYGNNLISEDGVHELVLDVNLGAFYKFDIGTLNDYPLPLLPFEVPPYRLDEYQEDIVVVADDVLVGVDEVQAEFTRRISGFRGVMYLTATSVSSGVNFSFSLYNNTNFLDWESVDSVGVDAEAYLYTGYMSGNEFMLHKQVPYVNFFFERTENGFYTDGDGNIQASNPSSCKVQAQWGWSDSVNSGKWGSEFQAYRYRRHYIPPNAADSYDYGTSVIETKNKLRGRGKVLSLYIHTDPGKDCRLLGWSMLVSSDGNV